MAKFHGVLGYAISEETSPGIYTETITEKNCSGDILRNSQRSEDGGQVISNVVLNNSFSVIGNAFAYQHLQFLRYVKWMDVKWKITNIEFRTPRIILTVGGVYNG